MLKDHGICALAVSRIHVVFLCPGYLEIPITLLLIVYEIYTRTLNAPIRSVFGSQGSAVPLLRWLYGR